MKASPSVVAYVYENRMMDRVSDSTLAPQGTATRAQAAAMLMRFVEGTGE